MHLQGVSWGSVFCRSPFSRILSRGKNSRLEATLPTGLVYLFTSRYHVDVTLDHANIKNVVKSDFKNSRNLEPFRYAVGLTSCFGKSDLLTHMIAL